MRLHAQKEFSLSEMLELAVASGVGHAMLANKAGVFKQLFGVTSSAVTTQLLEMQLGWRKKFDANAIGEQVLGKLTAIGMGMGMAKSGMTDPVLQNISNSFAQEFLNSTVHHGSFNVESVMLNSIGAVAADQFCGYIQQSFFPVPQTNIQQVEDMDFSLKDPVLPLSEANSRLSKMNLEKMRANNNTHQINKVNKKNTDKPQQNAKKTVYNSNSMWKPKQVETHKNNNKMVGFYTEDGIAFGGEAYLAGRTEQKPSATMTASDQYYYQQGKVMSKAVEIASHELDAMGLLELPSIALATKGVIFTAGKNVARNLNFFVRNGAEDVVQAATRHPLLGLSSENVVRLVNELGLETPKDQLLLWSGLGRDGVKLSQDYARTNGGITLEMTSGGKWLDEMNLFGKNSPFTPEESTKIWGDVSTLMARQASGQVRTLLGQVRPRSIYMTNELSEIMNNSKVLGIDEMYLKPRFIFK